MAGSSGANDVNDINASEESAGNDSSKNCSAESNVDSGVDAAGTVASSCTSISGCNDTSSSCGTMLAVCGVVVLEASKGDVGTMADAGEDESSEGEFCAS